MSKKIGEDFVYYNKEFDIISKQEICSANNSNIIYTRTVPTEIYDTCFEITTECNQHCRNCFAHSAPYLKGMIMPYTYVEEYIERIEDRRIRIGITGGEPFMHPEISNVLRLPFCFPNLNYVISTNGTIKLSHTLLDALTDGNWLVSISIHGNEKTHNAYTETEKFKIVIENLKLLSQCTTVHVYSVLNHFMSISDVDYILSLLDNYNVSFVRFITPRKVGRFDCTYDKNLPRYIEQRASNNLRVGIKISSSHTEMINVQQERIIIG